MKTDTKTFTFLTALTLVLSIAAFSIKCFSQDLGERKRIYLLAAGGYTFPGLDMEGGHAELGMEARLFGKVHARLTVDYYWGNKQRLIEGETVLYAYGFNLYGLYKLNISETLCFALKAGAHYTTVKTRLSAFGVTFTARNSDPGGAAGGGFCWQVSNRLSIFAEAEAKHLLSNVPRTWANARLGFLIRFR